MSSAYFQCWLKKNKTLALILLVGLFIVLGWMLLPGYVLTLDMLFAPHIPSPRLALGGYWNAALFRWPMYWVGLLVPGWVVQKLMFFGLFVALALQGYRFMLPTSFSTRTRCWAALFYVLNPFVYTRFLSGQWTILIAYSFLPAVWHFAGKTGKGEWKSGIFCGLALVFTFAFSLHIGVMALFVAAAAVIGSIAPRSFVAWKALSIAAGTFIVGTAYWTIPALFRKGGSIIEVFDARHLAAFRTVDDPVLGTIGNVLALGGFWGEREPWAAQFIWPMRQYPVLWALAGGILAAIIVWGVVSTLRNKESRRQGAVMLGLGTLAVVFSCGVGDSIFLSVNKWLFEHIGFWSGFRDSQKWSAVLVLVYAYFGGRGIEAGERTVRLKWATTIAGVAAVLVFTFPMLFGFWGQLKPVWYPESWHQANEFFRYNRPDFWHQDPNCRALFLPWHGYFTLKFNHNLLTASPARDFFECSLVMSRQVGLGEVGQQGPIDPAYDAIEGVVTGKDGWNSEQSLAILRQAGIKYVVFAQDIRYTDPWKYEFLNQPSLKVYTWDGLTITQLED